MRRRMMAAWRVLRGDWEAHPKPTSVTVYVDRDLSQWNGGVISSVGAARVTYRQVRL